MHLNKDATPLIKDPKEIPAGSLASRSTSRCARAAAARRSCLAAGSGGSRSIDGRFSGRAVMDAAGRRCFGGVSSSALAGILDRLFTYARGEVLSASQLEYLKSEGRDPIPARTSRDLVAVFHRSGREIAGRTSRLSMDERTLTQPRVVGRGQLPSTVLGLLVHAAEHTQRHVGQLLVTVRVQRNSC